MRTPKTLLQLVGGAGTNRDDNNRIGKLALPPADPTEPTSAAICDGVTEGRHDTNIVRISKAKKISPNQSPFNRVGNPSMNVMLNQPPIVNTEETEVAYSQVVTTRQTQNFPQYRLNQLTPSHSSNNLISNPKDIQSSMLSNHTQKMIHYVPNKNATAYQ